MRAVPAPEDGPTATVVLLHRTMSRKSAKALGIDTLQMANLQTASSRMLMPERATTGILSWPITSSSLEQQLDRAYPCWPIWAHPNPIHALGVCSAKGDGSDCCIPPRSLHTEVHAVPAVALVHDSHGARAIS